MEPNNCRYERKFFISGLSSHKVEAIVRHNPAMFSEIYYQRFVNNIYLDSFNFKNYFDNIYGSTNRTKVRIRWYGELSGIIKNPVLELKIKNGLTGRKELYPLAGFEFNDKFNVYALLDIFKRSDLPEIVRMQLRPLFPMIINRYNRKYFQSADKYYRVTVDDNLTYHKVGFHHNIFLNRSTDDRNIVLELKYDVDKELNTGNITNDFPFRLTKSSKYVNGINRLYI